MTLCFIPLRRVVIIKIETSWHPINYQHPRSIPLLLLIFAYDCYKLKQELVSELVQKLATQSRCQMAGFGQCLLRRYGQYPGDVAL